MKPVYLLFSLFLMLSANAQIAVFEPIQFSKESTFKKDNDSLSIKTLEMLGKLDESSKVESALPTDYNWTRDVRRNEAILRAISENGKKGADGRDLIPNVDKKNTEQLLKRSLQ